VGWWCVLDGVSVEECDGAFDWSGVGAAVCGVVGEGWVVGFFVGVGVGGL